MRYFFTTLIILIADQWTKWLVVKHMSLFQSIPVIDEFFHITSHRNRGAAFGILENQQWLFITITFIVIMIILYYLWQLKSERPWMSFSFALILGGAVGNLIDRIKTGEVVDFLDFRFGTYNFPIFNVADSAIVVGVCILVLITLFSSEVESNEKLSEASDS
ncbi:signal peptidase II [Paenactinomyces guangxiensis]|uniref:Lipoprotein signal peptidase n=1 Tax=Paenactinomyces guangxiensis TaxID=1490290 RepID=A0A7W2A8I6_9BACL|nr:signal peptidase II [Paenactinomyces guangxiensis]MBA4494224.1 signal peptidase II [Paenactinomyces guangxiensis]MBH8590720.1 signal peptidase II [Paenactinomyces guangxiensis]